MRVTAAALGVGAVALVVGWAWPTVASGQAREFLAERGPYRAVTVAQGLQEPWSIAFVPGGDVLVTEKPGRLRVIRDGRLLPDPIAGVPEVRFQGQGGLLDVVLHPDFETNRLVYLSYAKPNEDGSQGTTAVSRGRLEGDRLLDVEEIFEAHAWGTGGGHHGSRLAFDANNHLFITIGDRQAPPNPDDLAGHPAQDLGTHHGTVVRLHDDGRIPADNPFLSTSGALPEIWSYGHRSPQGLIIHPETGDVWVTEHGPQGGDELNLILPGRNYGWPVIGYGVSYGGSPVHLGTHQEGMEQPAQHWTPSIATSGLAVYQGDVFPEWNGNLLAGGLAGEQIARLPLVGEDGRQVGRMERPPLLLGFGRVRDVRVSPEGFVYVAMDNRRGDRLSEIVRLEPVR